MQSEYQQARTTLRAGDYVFRDFPRNLPPSRTEPMQLVSGQLQLYQIRAAGEKIFERSIPGLTGRARAVNKPR